MDKQFSEVEIQMTKKYMKKYSIYLVVREMEIKTTLGFHLTSVRLAIIKEKRTNASEGVGEKELSQTVGGKVYWYNHYGNPYGVSSKY
jgi:hypothetical protein